ncbi:MAG TPA: serine/threonine-protein kinase [Vicinamibacterales bacterium]|nr:serine/threonine-protein kinase [Vicinamibacterales bacterium]
MFTASICSRRIARRPIPLEEVLLIARQLAEALEAAHEQGIVHRDLKPANIKLKNGATVKVLDFGLARMFTSDAPAPDLSDAATVADAALRTREGVVMGTPPYMSPEQVRGTPADSRTDIWAFGCVLFEMLTGHVAFLGATHSDTIARILERDPEWHVLPSSTPAGVRRLLRRCLHKDPRERLQHMA